MIAGLFNFCLSNIKAALSLHDNGVAIPIIAISLHISEEKVNDIIQNKEAYEQKLNSE